MAFKTLIEGWGRGTEENGGLKLMRSKANVPPTLLNGGLNVILCFVQLVLLIVFVVSKYVFLIVISSKQIYFFPYKNSRIYTADIKS